MKEEKRNTEQRKRRWLRTSLCMILGASLIFGIFPAGLHAGFQPQNVQAATKKEQKAAKAAFKKFLSTSYIKWPSGSYYARSSYRFRYMTVGSKNTPVLILNCSDSYHAEGYCAVYTYINGKVRCQAALDWTAKVYQKSGVIAMCHCGGGYGEVNTWYYRVTDQGKLKQLGYTGILSSEYESMRKLFGKDKYQVNGKAVSKAKFQSYLKKWTGTKTLAGTGRVKTYKNTAANRKKYL